MFNDDILRCSNDLFDYVELAGCKCLPLVCPKDYMATVNTHDGRVLLDNNFYSTTSIPQDADPGCVFDLYLNPAMVNLSRGLYNLCNARATNFTELRPIHARGISVHQYPRGYQSAIRVCPYSGTTLPDSIGMGLRIGQQRYSILDLTFKRDYVLILLDRPLDEDIPQSETIWGSMPREEPELDGWTVVTAPCVQTAGNLVEGRVPLKAAVLLDSRLRRYQVSLQLLAGVIIPEGAYAYA
jgi:hypothetical protein